jgi:hypothetical protein
LRTFYIFHIQDEVALLFSFIGVPLLHCFTLGVKRRPRDQHASVVSTAPQLHISIDKGPTSAPSKTPSIVSYITTFCSLPGAEVISAPLKAQEFQHCQHQAALQTHFTPYLTLIFRRLATYSVFAISSASRCHEIDKWRLMQ